MKVRIAIKVQAGYMYSTISLYALDDLIKSLYDISTKNEVLQMLSTGSLKVTDSHKYQETILSTGVLEKSWEVLTKNQIVIFYDSNINSLYYSPWSIYFNGSFSTTRKVSTKLSDSFNALLCA